MDRIDAIAAGASLHFAGDPATDSTRRHLERILQPSPRRDWRTAVASLRAGAARALPRDSCDMLDALGLGRFARSR